MSKDCKYEGCTNRRFSGGYCVFHRYKSPTYKEPNFVTRTKKIKAITTKHARLMTAYLALRKVFLKDHPHCAAKLTGCRGWASDVHHKLGRGKFLLDISTWLPVCRHCHRWIEDHPSLAKELDFSASRLYEDDHLDNPGQCVNFTPLF